MGLGVEEKLNILADAAKYDVSCSSSGSKRGNENKGLGNTNGMGICHSFTDDGRCVSLLKILLTNVCIFDCAYCVSRKSNAVKRAAFTVEEVVDLTINFYRRNYIEGLFLSSGIFHSPDYTMERLVRIAKKLRTEHNFNGYIHLKAIPGASEELIKEAGLFADRLSVNIEIPSELSLQLVAPEKNYQQVLEPMQHITDNLQQNKEERKVLRHAPVFARAGQSTQMVVGATPEDDRQVLSLASTLYKAFELKRVYYSGYVPISDDSRLLVLDTPPIIRENRLYQADWLMRYYGFGHDELVTPLQPNLDLEIDPKLAYALRNLHEFPVEIQTAEYEKLLRIPGVGVRSAQRIVAARRFARLDFEHLKSFGVVLKRARFFLTCQGKTLQGKDLTAELIRQKITQGEGSRHNLLKMQQLSLFGNAA